MTTLPLIAGSTRPTHPFAGQAAIASGLIGSVALVCLIWYITTPAIQMQDSGITVPLGRLLIRIDFVGAALQALLMVPVAVYLASLARSSAASVNRVVLTAGIAGLVAVAVLRLVSVINPALSDILFMPAMGLVGAWLIAVNWLLKDVLSRGLRIIGTIAGISLLIMGVNFFVNGGMAEFAQPYAYGLNVRFHVGLAFTLPGFVLLPIWSILMGFRLIRERIDPVK